MSVVTSPSEFMNQKNHLVGIELHDEGYEIAQHATYAIKSA